MTQGQLQKPWNDPEQFEEMDVQLSCVGGSLLGIILAGSLYPVVLFIVGSIAVSAARGSTWADPLEFLLSILMIGLMGGAFGFMISMMTGLLSIILVLLMNGSLGNPVDARSAAISAGSMAGYIPTAWLLFINDAGSGAISLLVIGFFGPLLAMSMGAIGAAWASKKYSNYDGNLVKARHKHRFTILNLMAATGWVAVTFAVANAFGGLGFAIAVALWFVLQAVVLAAINFVAKLKPTLGS